MKNKRNWWIGSLIVLVILVVSITTFNNRTAKNEEIKIGVVASLTGPGAYFGEQFVSGMQMALTDLNTAGGINGKKVSLVIEDSKTDNTTALTVAKKLVEVDGVSIILGDSWNGTTLTMMPYTNEKKVILISPNASLDMFTEDDYMFRLIPRTSEFVKPLAKYLLDHGVKTVAFARVATTFTEEHLVDFRKEFESIGGKIIADEQFVSPGLDVRAELIKIKPMNPDAIFNIHNSGPSVGLLISQANQLGIQTKWVSTWATENGALVKQYPKEIEGIVYPFMYNESDLTTSKDFAERVRKNGKTADFFIASGFDILNLVAKIIKKADLNDPDELKQALLEVKNYSGASGDFGFDQNGDVIRNIFIKTVKNGSFIKAQ